MIAAALQVPSLNYNRSGLDIRSTTFTIYPGVRLCNPLTTSNSVCVSTIWQTGDGIDDTTRACGSSTFHIAQPGHCPRLSRETKAIVSHYVCGRVSSPRAAPICAAALGGRKSSPMSAAGRERSKAETKLSVFLLPSAVRRGCRFRNAAFFFFFFKAAPRSSHIASLAEGGGSVFPSARFPRSRGSLSRGMSQDRSENMAAASCMKARHISPSSDSSFSR